MLTLEYIAKIIFKQFTKWYFRLWFYNFVKKGQKQTKMTHLWGKKTKEKQNSAIMRISVDEIGIAFPVKLKITRGNVWIKILKKRILKKSWWI